MNTTSMIIIVAAAAVLLLVVSLVPFLIRRHSPKLNTAYFEKRWKELQSNCATRKTWPLAVIDADNLLNEALKKRHYKGKTTGERLVAAQHDLSDNNSVWYGHKLRNRIVHEDVRKMKKQDVLNALSGFRQALRDLGALK
ncbi:MAG: hypothetical protein WA843_02565 [Candidatus Saccharimonadales bacterium]